MPTYPNQWINPSQYYGVGGNDPNGYASTSTMPIVNQTKFNQMNNNIMVVPVSGQEGANAYPVAIGLTVMLLDYENKIFWLKSNDGLSTKLTRHVFTIEDPKEPNTSPSEKPMSEEFVSKTEFNELSKKVNSLLENLGESEN